MVPKSLCLSFSLLLLERCLSAHKWMYVLLHYLHALSASQKQRATNQGCSTPSSKLNQRRQETLELKCLPCLPCNSHKTSLYSYAVGQLKTSTFLLQMMPLNRASICSCFGLLSAFWTKSCHCLKHIHFEHHLGVQPEAEILICKKNIQHKHHMIINQWSLKQEIAMMSLMFIRAFPWHFNHSIAMAGFPFI